MFELYRAEAVEHARVARLGEVSSAAPYSSWRIWGFVVSAFLCLIALASLIQIPKREIVSGWVRTAGATARIESQGHWVVGDVFVRNGQRVRKGQPLFTAGEVVGSVADTNVRTQMLNSVAAEVTALNQQLLEAQTSYRDQARELAAKISAQTAARDRIRAQVALQQSRSRIAQQSLVDVEELVRKGFVSRLEYRRRQDNTIAAEQDELNLEREGDLLAAEIAGDQLALAQLNADTSNALARLRAQVANAEANRARLSGASHFIVRAPADGLLADWSLAPNTTMRPSTLAGYLVTEPARLIGEVFVPTSASGFLKHGQSVLLDYDGFPAAQFGFGRGSIATISDVPVVSQDLPAGGNARGGYRVILNLDRFAPRTNRTEWSFRPGLRFQAHFVLESVPLWRAVFAPVFGAEH